MAPSLFAGLKNIISLFDWQNQAIIIISPAALKSEYNSVLLSQIMLSDKGQM